jgi:hypothetical protein
MPPLAVMAAVGIGGAITGAIGSDLAAGAQSGAARSAAQLQHQDQQASLAFQQQQWQTQQANMAPWLKAGTQGIQSLSQLLGTPGQGLLTPWNQQFQAPTGAQAAQTPGYQFALQQGQNAIQNSAAAQGGLLSTGSQKTLDQYSQGLASQTYSDTYNRALAEYQQSYNIFQGNQTNTFNRLASLSGAGQTAATTLGNQGQAAANNISNINLTGGAQQGANLNLAGYANATGYAGIANSINGGLSSIGGIAALNQYAQIAAALKNAPGAPTNLNYPPSPDQPGFPT